MATTYNYDWSGYPKIRLVVNSITITNRTANSATVNYDVTASINGWYHYDITLTIKCGNGSKSHKLNPWGTKGDESNTYRDSRRLKGSFNISNLSTSSSNPGVAYVFSSKQNSHGNVTFGSTSNNSNSSVKIPAYTGSTTKPSNPGSGNSKPSNPSNSNNNTNKIPDKESITVTPIPPDVYDYKDGYSDFFPASGVEDNATQWLYNTFKIPNSMKDFFNKLNTNEYIKNALTSEEELSAVTDIKDVNGTISYKPSSSLTIETTNINDSGILGIPFQFNEYADVRSSVFGFNYIGRTYSRFIWNNMPLVHFEVGKPLYFDSLFGTSGNSISSYIVGLFGTSDEAELSDSFQKSEDYILGMGGVSKSRYYTFMDDFYDYTLYANTMIKFVALMMGLGDETCSLTGKKYRNFELYDLRNDGLVETLIQGNYLSFYYNPEQSSISESGSNSVGESVMSTMFSNINAMSREIQFLFGTDYVSNIMDNDTNVNTLAETVSKFASNLKLDDTGFFNRLTSIGSCLSGANILFPHIWQDSQFTKTYSLNFKFTSPYGDPESILMNIYIPYLCLLALSMPRQASSQGYKSPFLVKVSSKGWFNCDMGMVESIDIKRGGPNNDQWTVDGLPTEMEINLTIRDLYPTIMATSGSGAAILLANNSSFTEYLTMLSGVDMHVVTPMDRTSVLANVVFEDILAIPESIFKKFISGIQSKIKWFYRKFLE